MVLLAPCRMDVSVVDHKRKKVTAIFVTFNANAIDELYIYIILLFTVQFFISDSANSKEKY